MPRIEPVPMAELPDDVRVRLEEGLASGRLSTTVGLQISARAPEQLRRQLDQLESGASTGKLNARIRELVRLRSAQVNGCEPCAAARREQSITESEVTCMIDGGLGLLTDRERAAVRFTEMFSTDHRAIDDAVFAMLRNHFDDDEIVELGLLASAQIGGHRWNHVLRVPNEDADPT